MDGQEQGQAGRPVRRERAWWQWVLGVGLIGTAGVFAVLRYFPGLGRSPNPQQQLQRPVEPREVRLSTSLQPSDVVPAAPGELAGSNLLLVTFDTTRADRIGCYGNDEIDTPSLDRIAAEGVVFSKVLAPSPTTLPSHSSMMTGLYPFHHGARANNTFRLGGHNRTLAEILTDEGYATGAAVSATVLDAQFGIDQGFRDYDDEMEEGGEGDLRKIAQRKGDRTTDRAEEWLRKHADEKFFMWVHLYDPHAPYQAPDAYNERYDLPYDAEIAFTDAQLGRLLALLDELRLTEDTLVVVAGDHGEGLGQHREAEHACLIYDSTLHVPLVMRCGRKLGGGVQVSRWVSLVDLTPTILTLLGVESPDRLDGMDLTQPAPAGPRTVYSETLQGLADHGWAALLGVHEDGAKLIYGPRLEVYDLTEDPFEEDNLVDDLPELAASLETRLRAFYGDDLEKALSAKPTHQPSPEMLARLQSLGYLAGGAADMSSPADRPHPLDMMPALARVTAVLGAEEEIGLENVITRLERIARNNPDFATVYRHLGQAYMKNGDPEEAEAAFARCIEIRPGDPQPYLALAGLKVQQRRIDEAIVLHRQVIEIAPDHFGALFGLAKLLLSQGEYAEAADLMAQALEVRPRDKAVPDMLTDALIVVDRADEAVAIFERHLEADPNLPMVRNGLARLLAARQQFAEAADLLREGLRLAPDQYELANNLAFMLCTCPVMEIRKPVEAIVLMERVCEETRYEDPRYMHTLSLLYATMNRMDEAITMAERARTIASASKDPALAQLAPTIGLSIQRYERQKAAGAAAHDPISPRADDGEAMARPQRGTP